ncbi:MAG: type II toxin-antitoxin system RelE/ParE family toxin [Acidobacteriia bacterium]|nr:type II toxin-antitoxin system RelE/ParE family toxin [Terriglobia bacterium]
MAFLVDITARAERDLAVLYADINAQHSGSALAWYRGLKKTILSLENHPNRGSLTRKRGNLRHLLYGHKPHLYRVIYRVLRKQKRVEILHIRHGARRKLKPSDLAAN